MDAGMILTIVFICVGIALVVLLVEAILAIRRARATIDNVQKQLEPTLAHVEQITNDIKPAIAKVDPLVDRVSLTVDAANLEMMRVDQILEDITQITDTASNAIEAVDNVASAPLDLMNNVSAKVRNIVKPKAASDESKKLEQQRVAAAKALDDLRAAEEKAGKAAPADFAVKSDAEEAPESVSSGEGKGESYFTYEEPASLKDAE